MKMSILEAGADEEQGLSFSPWLLLGGSSGFASPPQASFGMIFLLDHSLFIYIFFFFSLAPEISKFTLQ